MLYLKHSKKEGKLEATAIHHLLVCQGAEMQGVFGQGFTKCTSAVRIVAGDSNRFPVKNARFGIMCGGREGCHSHLITAAEPTATHRRVILNIEEISGMPLPR